MTTIWRTIGVVSIVVTGILFGVPQASAAQFGKGIMKGKTEVDMKRRLPPRVVVPTASVKVEVVSRAARLNLAEVFRETVERQLIFNLPALQIGQSAPETLVQCTITRLNFDQTAGSRVVYVSKQTGTKQELNTKTGKMETKAVYESVPETQYFTTVNADLRVEVRVRVLGSGAWVAAQTHDPSFSKEYAAGTTPPQQEIETRLVARGARAAAAEVTPSVSTVSVMLGRPNGDVDDRNKLAEAGLWARMAEELEHLKPLSEPKKDAYRIFNIGVANEALAYAADDLAATKRFLERASAMYAQALQLKPDEEYFTPPIARVKESVARFTEFERQQNLLASGGSLPDITQSASGDPVTVSAGEPSAPTTGGQTPAYGAAMSNKDVIELLRAGLSEENLLAAVKDAKAVKFDLSVQGLKELLGAKVPNTVVVAMRSRMQIPLAR